MRKLMRANLFHLFRNNVFWLELTATVFFAGWIALANYSPEIQAGAERLYLDDIFFNFYQLLSVFLAAGIGLILGTEYSDGTLRNKLIAGHSRGAVYFSLLFTAMLSAVLVVLSHGAVTYVMGRFLFGKIQMPLLQFAELVLLAALDALVFAALFTAIALNCPGKASGAVICLILSLALTFGTSMVYNKLREPEMSYDGIRITQDGIQLGEMIPNPAYVSGMTRKAFEFVCDLLPSGQLMQIQAMELERAARWLPLSLLLLVGVTAVGCGMFLKRDLK